MLISLDDITIKAGERRLFEHTTWHIGRAQRWAITGPNGSGKSTLAKAVSRGLPLFQGRIVYFFDPHAPQGRAYLNPNEILTFSAETHQAFLRQFVDYHQARWQSIEGELAPTVSHLLSGEPLSPYASPAAGQASLDLKGEAAASLFGLEFLLGRKMHQLSHGELRKVFLVRLLLRSPKLLILDDPYTGLDQELRTRLRVGIEQLLEKQDPPVLLVSSREDDLPEGVDHLLRVEDNRVVDQGARDGMSRRRVQPSPAASARSGQAAGFSPSRDFTAMLAKYAAALEKNSPSMPVMVQMEDVSVHYREAAVLQKINWTVGRGERWALTGPNGAGKSTLLSLILADNPQAYTNDIHLFGRKRGSGESIWEIKKKIGWVSPELHIFYEKTASCLDVICSGFFDSVGLYRRSSEEQAAEARAWLVALGMDSLAGQPFESLSTGQQRLVLLARALVKNPPLLILDEPCQGLDDFRRAFFTSLIDQLCVRAPVTLIYVSHYADEIPTSITHQLSLDHGQILRMGVRSV